MRFVSLVLALLPVGVFAGVITDEQFEEIITDVGTSPRIEIDNTAGSVRVVGQKTTDVTLSGKLSGKVKGVFIESAKGRVMIRVKSESGHGGWRDSGSANLTLSVPMASELDIATVSAEIDVGKVRGELRLKSVSGSIETDAYSDEVIAESVSGDVRIDGNGEPMEEVRLSSVSGDVIGRKLHGEIEASSVSGDIVIRDSYLSNGDFSTTSGDIEVGAEVLAGARIDFESVSGEVEYQIAGTIDGEYDISTFSGDIDNCFGPEPEERGRRNQRLRFEQGKTEHARIDITTMSGDIELCN
ncbi:MAG: DUF4097 family beta strand repeat-containing protein [Pseudomonadota bacterium]